MGKNPNSKKRSIKYSVLEISDTQQIHPDESASVSKAIRLNPGVSKINFFCCIFHYVLIVFSLIIIDQLHQLRVIDNGYLTKSRDGPRHLATFVMVVQAIVRMIVAIPYGHYADKIGRKKMIRYGVLSYLAGGVLTLFHKSITGFIFSQLILSNGVAAMSSAPLLADYIADRSKGKASGIASMMISLCAIFFSLFFQTFQENLQECSIIIPILLFLNTFGLPAGEWNANTPSFVENFKEALSVYKANGWLHINSIMQIIGSSNFQIFITILTAYKFSDRLTTAAYGALDNIQILVFLSSFFSSYLYGYFLDKPNKTIWVLLFALGGGACSSIIMVLSTGLSDWKIWIGALLLGTTISGLFVMTNFLNIKNFPPEKRGIMTGFLGLFANLGYLALSLGGSFLFEN